MLPALLITPTLLALTLVSGCKNSYQVTKKPDAWGASSAIKSGQTLVWSDVEKAELDCGQALLESAWGQLFAVAASDPHSSQNASMSWGEVRGRAAARGVSVAALSLELSIDGFAKVSVSDATDGASPESKSVLSISFAGQTRNLEFGPHAFPRFVALFSPETVGRRKDPNTPADLDLLVDQHFSEATQATVDLKVDPAVDGMASKVTLEVGQYSTCVHTKLKLSQLGTQ